MALYNKAGEILEKLESQKGTIRSLCLADDVVEKKRTYALVCESLKYKDALQIIIKQTGLVEAEKQRKIRPGVILVLVYDFLFGRGLQTTGSYKEVIMKHQTRLKAELAKLKIKRKVTDNKMLIPEHIRNAIVLPRWVRVNTLVASVDKVIGELLEMGYAEDADTESSQLKGKAFQRDKHIPEMLLLPSNVDLHANPLLLNGSIIIQDKASCFPAYVLNAPRNSICIDACAAPGNKTSHLSAVMGNTGKIFAFDMDKRRLTILQKMTKRAGCKNIEPVLCDFLEVKVTDKRYKDVEYILLDPSCSGSGIVGRMDHLIDQDTSAAENESEEDVSAAAAASEARVTALADFQAKAILHGFQFPKVKKVVYSTCSKHREENEDVVQKVLAAQTDFVLAPNAFPQWTRRGLPLFDGADRVIRTEPREDHCIGFFVALFQRKSSVPLATQAAAKRNAPEGQDGHAGEPVKKKARKNKKKKPKKRSAATS
ncbi:S-adenosyl-L-methionine-dependent methyltransferase [Geranomyces variabilis]|nr:S-adenosyl-L-methionine-dependent methyltransferase [Geranomyces variabilis]KAJ3140609.1 putative 28S rRNA (cytosine-C(5))-methyltransferase [Geranomyces variabilis]